MSNANNPLSWLPGFLIVAGSFFLIAGIYAGIYSGGSEMCGGIVFGGVSLAAAAAILYRRAYDERKSKSNDENNNANGA